jgi:hypothetical protein
MAATGCVDTSWRKSMRRPSGSRTRREVQFLASPLAVAQTWIRSSRSPRSTCSTWMVGGKILGQFSTSAMNR